jgi:hypothetical protein
MAYTSVLPVHRLDRSIDYVKDRAKTTKSAGSLEEAIDYALNREKTEPFLKMPWGVLVKMLTWTW